MRRKLAAGIAALVAVRGCVPHHPTPVPRLRRGYDDEIDVENATTTIVNTTTYYSRDLAIEAVPGVIASNNIAVGSGNPLNFLNVVYI